MNKPAPKESATKRRLFRTAIRLFAEKGYDGLSVDEIVTAARVNKRMVYHYFGSKELLYEAVLREVYGRLTRLELSTVHPAMPVDASLEALIRAYFDFLWNNPEFVQLLLWENLAQGRHLSNTVDEISKAPILQILHQVIAKGIKQNQIRRGFRAEHLLINLIGLCLIYYSNRYTLSRTVGINLHSRRVLDEGIGQAVQLVKHGILAGKGAKPWPKKSKSKRVS